MKTGWYHSAMRREPIILSYIKEKDVLDIGSVGQDLDSRTREVVQRSSESSQKLYLWNFLNDHARSLTGIDLEATPGDGIIRGNMETYSFGKEFDVVIAGDVLEHVNNQGLFLENIARHLKRDGKAVITTPNAKWPTVFLKPNETHTVWHDRYTLTTMIERAGMRVEKLVYYVGNKASYSWWKIPLILRQGILVVCGKG